MGHGLDSNMVIECSSIQVGRAGGFCRKISSNSSYLCAIMTLKWGDHWKQVNKVNFYKLMTLCGRGSYKNLRLCHHTRLCFLEVRLMFSSLLAIKVMYYHNDSFAFKHKNRENNIPNNKLAHIEEIEEMENILLGQMKTRG